MLGRLHQNDINALLSSQAVGRIGCCHKGKPYIFPVHYAFDGTHIFCQTNDGTKLDIIAHNPKVCFEVDTMIDVFNWKSVVVTGRCEVLEGSKGDNAREFLYKRVMPLLTPSLVHLHEHENSSEIDDSTRIREYILCITIDETSGRYQRL